MNEGNLTKLIVMGLGSLLEWMQRGTRVAQSVQWLVGTNTEETEIGSDLKA